MKKEEVIKVLREHMDEIRQFGVKRIGIFGSVVRGEAREDSDIDILVEFEEGKKTFDNYMELKFLLEDLFQRKVDLVLANAIKAELRDWILNEVEYA